MHPTLKITTIEKKVPEVTKMSLITHPPPLRVTETGQKTVQSYIKEVDPTGPAPPPSSFPET